MTDSKDQCTQAKTLIRQLYNSTADARLRDPLMKAYQRLEDGADVNDLVAHTASAVNYIRLTEKLTFSKQQDSWWQSLRDLGSATILYHDPKDTLLDLSER